MAAATASAAPEVFYFSAAATTADMRVRRVPSRRSKPPRRPTIQNVVKNFQFLKLRDEGYDADVEDDHEHYINYRRLEDRAHRNRRRRLGGRYGGDKGSCTAPPPSPQQQPAADSVLLRITFD